MRNTVLSLLLSASVGCGLQHTALAADMPVKTPILKAPIAAPVYDWSGLYVARTLEEHGPIARLRMVISAPAGIPVAPGS